jgi:lysine 2,3-aminomutase
LPQRITEDLADMLKKYHPIWLNTQFNHPNEITPESERACDILLSRGIPLGNQSVLLKGINDDAETMKKLVHELVRIRVRPYYIYHCHYVKGGMHFQTEISKGKEIIRKLQGYTTGFAVPRYIISTPIGKIPLHNDYVVFENDEYMELQNYSGEIVKVRKNL